MLKVGCSVHLLSVADRKCCRRPAVCGHLHSDPAMRACCCYTPMKALCTWRGRCTSSC